MPALYYVIYSIMLHHPSTIIFLPTRIAITTVFPLRVLQRSKAVPIRRMNILPEIPWPNPWDMWSIVAIRLNVFCGSSVNHPVTPQVLEQDKQHFRHSLMHSHASADHDEPP